MSNDAASPDSGLADVPSLRQIGWLLFMQPVHSYELLRLWDLDTDPSLWRLWPRLRMGDQVTALLVRRLLTWLLLIAPIASLAGLSLWFLLGGRYGIVAGLAGLLLGIPVGIGFWAVRGIFFGTALGVSFILVFTSCFAWAAEHPYLSFGKAFGLAFGVIGAAALGLALAIVLGVSFSTSGGLQSGLIQTLLFGIVCAASLELGAGTGLLFFVVFLLFLLRLPFYLFESAFTLFLAALPRWGWAREITLARWLPFLHHDLIFLPLPGLRIFLIELGEKSPSLAQQRITQAAGSLAQGGAARLALLELQARTLERAAHEGDLLRTAELRLPFLGEAGELSRPFLPAFQTAARDLLSARSRSNHLHRREALDRAERVLGKEQLRIAALDHPGPGARRLLAAFRCWLALIAEERAVLERDERECPQIPNPFVAGPPLGPEDRRIFRGRDDLIRLIDHDLTGARRVPILLIGQRRMGKSSLLNLLPLLLGAGTTVIKIDLQGLSGWVDRSHPYREILRKVIATQTGLCGGSVDHVVAWSQALERLLEVDIYLHRADTRLLVTLDEVERLEDGIREGWVGTELLDFLRAASDSLQRIRFLLVSAYPLARLGPHWVDRLINVLQRRIPFLDEAAARDLICSPIPNFPDIYPPGGVERILAETRGHPYLIQLICETLCRHLNEQGRRMATISDIDLTVDRAMEETSLFDEIWRSRTMEERAVLQSIASGRGAMYDSGEVIAGLESEGYAWRQDGRLALAIPMMAPWIVDRIGGIVGTDLTS